ncbi:GNAT family N-acetyltransferase [Caldilinea sp.]|uniref:GNAT family N-acetyltransferase n=1 Tax=Caldilinea sp. TaxID=2293560 RepID=UPI002BE96C81|nr:GNAT family N-acetyltransferase [Anaerolineales bacterium]HQY91584.1 GNAT family N-acetyltransferase [Caldilinea sp.]
MSGTLYHIRPVIADDIASVALLHVAVWQEAYRGMLPDPFLDAISVERREAMWRRTVEEQDSPALVAEHTGRIVGFLLGGPARDEDAVQAVTSEIYALYVAPDRWRTGAGAQLMHEGLSVLREQSYQEVTLWVLRANERARRFYERMGFQTDGSEKVDERFGVTFDEIRYRLEFIEPVRSSLT